MKKNKIKRLTAFFLTIFGLIYLFTPPILPQNTRFLEALERIDSNDIIIIFTSGGWGNTPLKEAKDLAPIIEGIQEKFKKLGYDSFIIPYFRTKNTILGKISSTKDFLHSFEFSSKDLSEKIELLTHTLPENKIILTGLSNGAALIEETMKKISDSASIYAIEIGAPFWEKGLPSENILRIQREEDSLAKGEIDDLVLTFFKAPFKWLNSKLKGENLGFSEVLNLPGHCYPWSLSEIHSQIIGFLENRVLAKYEKQ